MTSVSSSSSVPSNTSMGLEPTLSQDSAEILAKTSAAFHNSPKFLNPSGSSTSHQAVTSGYLTKPPKTSVFTGLTASSSFAHFDGDIDLSQGQNLHLVFSKDPVLHEEYQNAEILDLPDPKYPDRVLIDPARTTYLDKSYEVAHKYLADLVTYWGNDHVESGLADGSLRLIGIPYMGYDCRGFVESFYVWLLDHQRVMIQLNDLTDFRPRKGWVQIYKYGTKTEVEDPQTGILKTKINTVHTAVQSADGCLSRHGWPAAYSGATPLWQCNSPNHPFITDPIRGYKELVEIFALKIGKDLPTALEMRYTAMDPDFYTAEFYKKYTPRINAKVAFDLRDTFNKGPFLSWEDEVSEVNNSFKPPRKDLPDHMLYQRKDERISVFDDWVEKTNELNRKVEEMLKKVDDDLKE